MNAGLRRLSVALIAIAGMSLFAVAPAALASTDDIIAPSAVGAYVHARMRNSVLVPMKATGHCPNLSAPDETIAVIEGFLEGLP